MFCFTNEMRKRFAYIEFYAIKFMDIISKTTNAQYLNSDVRVAWIEDTIYTFDDQKESHYDFMNKTLEDVMKKNIDENTRKRIDELLKDLKEFKPLYLLDNIDDKINVEEILNAKWNKVKIDMDFIGKKFQSKGKEYCRIRFPSTSMYNQYSLSVPLSLLQKAPMEVYFVANPNFVFSISRYNFENKKFDNLNISFETLKHQFDDYYSQLNNNPQLSLMRIKEEYAKTGYLDINKLERNILFNEYQVIEIYQGYLMDLDVDQYFDDNLSYKQMDSIKQQLIEDMEKEIELYDTDIQSGEMINGQ